MSLKSEIAVYMSYTLTQDIRPEQPARFRFWFQGKGGSGTRVDFGDGTRLADYQENSEVPHSFKKPGIHIVTNEGEAGGRRVIRKLKVVVRSTSAIRQEKQRVATATFLCRGLLAGRCG
ncbi:MAG: hypothetical protein LAO04_12680 [Acidobacteriia bacterium]|nr:hypothetical protein [Terriglobia bacterium]